MVDGWVGGGGVYNFISSSFSFSFTHTYTRHTRTDSSALLLIDRAKRETLHIHRKHTLPYTDKNGQRNIIHP